MKNLIIAEGLKKGQIFYKLILTIDLLGSRKGV